MTEKRLTFRRYKDGDHARPPLQEAIFNGDHSYKCPTYVHRTPPCQGSCPAGEDIRGWLNIARGIEKPPAGMPWQEYAFYRATDANPFPAIMGRVCPAPCEDGCNRNEVEDHVGINAVEHFIGNYALEKQLKLPPAGADTGKKVAIIGSGPAGLACAYQLRRMGHACTIFERHAGLGGMMRYGIPGYRTPRDVLDGEVQRILDMGVDGAHRREDRRGRRARGARTGIRCGLPRTRRSGGKPAGGSRRGPGRQLHQRHRFPRRLQRRPAEARRQPGPGDRRRRHGDGCRRGSPADRPHFSDQRERPARIRGARADRARRGEGGKARRSGCHDRVPPADGKDARDQDGDRAHSSGRGSDSQPRSSRSRWCWMAPITPRRCAWRRSTGQAARWCSRKAASSTSSAT